MTHLMTNNERGKGVKALASLLYSENVSWRNVLVTQCLEYHICTTKTMVFSPHKFTYSKFSLYF